MRIVVFIIIFLPLSLVAQNRSDILLKIVENNNYGFIDLHGNIVIAPQFKGAGNFSEGLASVRQNGTYGYIDRTGIMVIPDRYDYAEDFNNGLAIVYLNGKPQIIRHNGSILQTIPCRSIEGFQKGIALIITNGGHYAVIDTTGKLLTDTLFRWAVRSKSDSCIHLVGGKESKEYETLVWGPGNAKYTFKSFIPNAIIRNNRIIVDFKRSADFPSGHAIFSLENHKYYPIDTAFNTTFFDKYSEGIFIGKRNLHEGAFHSIKPDTTYRWSQYAVAFLDTLGVVRTVIGPAIATSEFHGGTALMITTKGYFLVNKKGEYTKQIGDLQIHRGIYPRIGIRYNSGHYIVPTDSGEVLVDTTGKIIHRAIHRNVLGFLPHNQYFFESERFGDNTKIYSLYSGSTISLPEEWRVSHYSNSDALMIISKGDALYLAYNGDTIYHFKDTAKYIPIRNTTYQRSAQYLLLDTSTIPNVLNTYGNTSGAYRPDTNDTRLTVFSDSKDTIHYNVQQDTQLRTINNGTSDSMRVYNNSICLQALDTRHQWRDIELLGLESTECPLHYDDDDFFLLPPHTAVRMAGIFYTGSYKTKLRLRCNVTIWHSSKHNSKRSENEKLVFSNEFEGCINPAQLWRQWEPGIDWFHGK